MPAFDHTTWNATLAEAVKFTDLTLSASTIPTSTNATEIWKGVNAQIRGLVMGAGLTPSDTADNGDTEYLANAEALIVSADVAATADAQQGGEELPWVKSMRERGWAMIYAVTGSPDGSIVGNVDILEELGATLTASKRPALDAFAASYPNDDLDTSDYENQLDNFKVSGDL